MKILQQFPKPLYPLIGWHVGVPALHPIPSHFFSALQRRSKPMRPVREKKRTGLLFDESLIVVTCIGKL